MGDSALGEEGAGASRDQSGWGGPAGAAAIPSLDLRWDADGHARAGGDDPLRSDALLPALSFFSVGRDGFEAASPDRAPRGHWSYSGIIPSKKREDIQRVSRLIPSFYRGGNRGSEGKGSPGDHTAASQSATGSRPPACRAHPLRTPRVLRVAACAQLLLAHRGWRGEGAITMLQVQPGSWTPPASPELEGDQGDQGSMFVVRNTNVTRSWGTLEPCRLPQRGQQYSAHAASPG